MLVQFEAPPFCVLALSPESNTKGDWVSVSRRGTVSFWKGVTLRKTIELNVPVASAVEAVGHEILLTGTEEGKILSVPLLIKEG